jgi:hypothetical protein
MAENPAPGATRLAARRVFVGGFYQWLRHFSKDPERVARAFARAFDLDQFDCATIDGDIVAITAYTNGRELARSLGPLKGTIAHQALKANLEDHPYPFRLLPEEGAIEFVATATRHRDHFDFPNGRPQLSRSLSPIGPVSSRDW